jgi:hypothetical protein
MGAVSQLVVLKRLLTLPLLAGLVVLLVGALSLWDLRRPRTLVEPRPADPEALQVLRKPPGPLVPSSSAIEELTEREALERLEETPGRAALLRLWPERKHRERLFQLLVEKETAWDLRLFLLGRFERESPAEALRAARSLAGEQDLAPPTLVLSVYEVLARHGERPDLALLDERAGEPHQLRTRREEHRDALRTRVGG